MPIWLVIMVAGAAGCGFLFLKAREHERARPFKKVKQGSLTVKKKAKAVAARPSTVVEKELNTSVEEVIMSKDMAGRVAAEVEEIQQKKKEG